MLHSKANENYYFQDITAHGDLKYDAILTICEDSKGFVWFGTQNGLYQHTTNSVKQVSLLTSNTNLNGRIRVVKLYNDQLNNLWICTSEGLYRYSTNIDSVQKITLPRTKKETFTRNFNNIIRTDSNSYILHVNNKLYRYNLKENTTSLFPFEGNVKHIYQDQLGHIYLGTHDGQVYVIQNHQNRAELLYTSDKKNISSLCIHANDIYIGYLGYGIDIISKKGLKKGELLYNTNNKKDVKQSFVRDMVSRDNGELWIATQGGLIRWSNGQEKTFNSIFGNGLPHRAAYVLYKGQYNNIWVGTFSAGLAYYADYNYHFSFIPITDQQDLDASHTVTTFFEDDESYIWIGSEEDGGIKRYNTKDNTFVEALPPHLNEDTKHISTIRQIDDQTIGITMVFSRILRIYNYKKHQLINDIEFPSIGDVGILSAFKIGNKWWVSGQDNALIYNPINKKKQIVYPPSKAKAPNLTYNYLDPQGQVWLCTKKGLYLKRLDKKTAEPISTPQQVIDLGQIYIYTVCMDNNGQLWVGTKGKGLYVYSPQTKRIEQAPNHELTQNSDIYSLLCDNTGNIWYNTSQGLYQYNIHLHQTQNYGSMDGIPHTRTRSNSAFCSHSGDLYFGTKGGFNIIRPSIINKNPHPPVIKLASLTVNNSAYKPSQFEHSTTLQNALHLKHNENTLTFKLACNNYTKYQKNRFKYRLTDYDDSWNYVSYNTPIVYTKIPPGKYTLEAYAANNDGVWSTVPYHLDIIIAKHPLFSNKALMLYFILIFAICFFIYREIKNKVMLKKTLTEERYKAEANALIYDERVKFYTNLSHELRSPLSLIISPIRTLLEDKERIYNPTRLLKTIDRNANRLFNIVDQSIDFRLLEIGKIEAHLEQHDIINLVNEAYLCFEQQINEKELRFRFTTEYDSIETTIDKDLTEKIMYNLLSNAIKYTDSNGHISLSIKERNLSEEDYINKKYAGVQCLGKSISIAIKNTGPGISPNMLNHIFERFAKGEKAHHLSTGIGLHLCKEYAKLNLSSIIVESKQGKGATFTLNIPLAEHFSQKKIAKEKRIKDIIPEEEPIFLDAVQKGQKQHTILLTEDNDELRSYLKSLLNMYYKTLTTKSGEDTLELLEDIVPDLIITDLTMPGINGLQLTQTIKENSKWKHIPVILMTGQSDRNLHKESIIAGADAFLKKPIEESLLVTQINKILSKQEEIKNTSILKNIKEETFMQKVDRIIQDKLHDPEFEINDLLKELEIGRTTLSRRIEAETKLTPSSYIRKSRLQYACKLLEKKELSIDDIAQYVGFNSSSYFTRSFKLLYGMPPAAYRRRL